MSNMRMSSVICKLEAFGALALNNIPLSGWTSLFIHSPTKRYLGCFQVATIASSCNQCCGTLNTNTNTLGFHVFVKQEVELNIPEVPTGFKVLCVAWGCTDSHLLKCSI